MESTTIPNHHSRNDIGTSINTTNSNPNPPANPNSSKFEIITTTSHIPPPAPNPRAKPTSPSSITSSITSPPPYWSHNRPISQVSIESIDPSGITLRDNTAEGDDGDVHGDARGKNEACWARSVVIEDYVVVNGSGRMGSGMGISNIGAFVVWNVRVDTLEGNPITIRKRYSEFADLRGKLLRTFPNSAGTIPELPRKSVISKFRPKFLENRRSGLQYFLNCILLNPEFSSSPVLKEFLFS